MKRMRVLGTALLLFGAAAVVSTPLVQAASRQELDRDAARALKSLYANQSAARMLGTNPQSWPAGRATYDLRRLRLHGLIERIPHTHRYRVTDAGLRLALFLPRVWARTLRPGLATIMPDLAPNDGPLRRAFERLEHAMDDWCEEAKVGA